MKIESHMANPQPVVKLAGDYAVPFCVFLSIVTRSLDAEQGLRRVFATYLPAVWLWARCS